MIKFLIIVLLILVFILLRNKNQNKIGSYTERFTLISPLKTKEVVQKEIVKKKVVITKAELNYKSSLLAKFISEIEKIKERWTVLIPNEKSNIYDLILYIDVLYKTLNNIFLEEKIDVSKLDCEDFDKYCSFELTQEALYDEKGNYQDKSDFDNKTYTNTYKGQLQRRINNRRRQTYRDNKKDSKINHEKIKELLYEADLAAGTINKDLLKNSNYELSIDEFEKQLKMCFIPHCHKQIDKHSILQELKFLYDTIFDILIRNEVITFTSTDDFRLNYAAIYHEEKILEEDEDPEYLPFTQELELFLDICKLKLEKIKLQNEHKDIKIEGILKNYIYNHSILTNKKVPNK